MPIIPPTETEYVTFGLRLPLALREELDAAAQREGLSRNALVYHLLRHGLDALRKENSQRKGKKPKK